MRKLTSKELQRIRVDVQKKGFTIWIKDTDAGIEHWLIDGSLVKCDGEIRIDTMGTIHKTMLDISDNVTLMLVRKGGERTMPAKKKAAKQKAGKRKATKRDYSKRECSPRQAKGPKSIRQTIADRREYNFPDEATKAEPMP